MKVIRFDFDEHTELILEWLKCRGMDESLADNLPHIGFICFYNSQAIGAIFLRYCEGNIGMVDSLITNPNSIPDARNEAINLLVQRIIDRAKHANMKSLIGFSIDENTLKRAETFGFKKEPFSIITRRIIK